MTVVTRQAMVDDNGDFISGTVVTKAFVDQVYDQIDDQVHSSTNPTIKPKATTDEVVTARGSMPSLDARLDVAHNEDGTLKAISGAVTQAQVQSFIGGRNTVENGDFRDWSGGGAAAPNLWTLGGAGAAVAKTGPGEADTFTFGTEQYAAKVTRSGADADLSQDIIPAASFANYVNVKTQKYAVSVKVKTAVASQAKIRVDDGITTTDSSFHTGGGTEEHLSVVHTISASATKLTVKLLVLTSNGPVYFGGVQGVFSEFALTDWQPFSQPPSASLTARGVVDLSTQSFRGQKVFETQPTFNPGTSASAIGVVGGWIHANATAVGNVGAGQDDLMSFSVPANTLSADLKALRATMFGSFAANANNKQLHFVFGGVSINFEAGNAYNGMSWRADFTIIRLSSSVLWATVSLKIGSLTIVNATENYVQTFTGTSFDFTVANTMKMQGTGVANDDIVQNGFLLELVG